MKHLIYASNVQFSSKPDRARAGIASDSMEPMELDCNQLAEHIAQGKSFCLASFIGKRNISNFDSATLLAVDIDTGNKTFAELCCIWTELKLKPCIVYETFSSSEETKKWRIVWQCDEQIFDAAEFKALLKYLVKQFNADSACADSARLMFGTNKAIAMLEPRNFISLCKFPELEIQQYSPANSKASYMLDEAEQKAIIDKLPYAIKLSLSKQWESIASEIAKPCDSRYKALWHSSRKLAQAGFLADNIIAESLLAEIKKHAIYADYDKDIVSIVYAGIRWGRKHSTL